MSLPSVPDWLAKWGSEQLETKPHRMSKDELLAILKSAPETVTVVDLRNDRERGYITKAVHIPATVIEGPTDIQNKLVGPVLAQFPQTKKIVVHCNLSAKRAGLIGAWGKDHVAANGPQDVDVQILHEGIVGWLAAGDDFKDETTLV
ncbi:hypothetical protein METBIDRAFT_9426 [Metschnikowia bicuspidata var. bicuspidata NRRL YB-4993]|uniref:Rhodanese domain-containing protein n=1 Tax=Metschnikowia bicuspidata var. bicuspidata NRRL YB-4993 TaxID=869754 RepID=A0A1A0HGK0_9ASCO|nr:hypothetical protein METBIDRAFT_9426 [Metschnikowia bicuspidata var. bicuspidata NRRL YB-4993]OBA23120.1 hypothetical protein METBIDRAFT_9426 [Metschnikowia bicuspidata var. bicuspidata NRRL YB-4993]